VFLSGVCPIDQFFSWSGATRLEDFRV